jgi:hypothetical protein
MSPGPDDNPGGLTQAESRFEETATQEAVRGHYQPGYGTSVEHATDLQKEAVQKMQEMVAARQAEIDTQEAPKVAPKAEPARAGAGGSYTPLTRGK